MYCVGAPRGCWTLFILESCVSPRDTERKWISRVRVPFRLYYNKGKPFKDGVIHLVPRSI